MEKTTTTRFTTSKGNLLTIWDNGAKFSDITVKTHNGNSFEALLLDGAVITGSRLGKKIIESAYKEYQKSISKEE